MLAQGTGLVLLCSVDPRGGKQQALEGHNLTLCSVLAQGPRKSPSNTEGTSGHRGWWPLQDQSPQHLSLPFPILFLPP